VSERSVTRRAVAERKRCNLDSLERAYNKPDVVNTCYKRKGNGFLLLGHLGMGFP